MANVGTVMTSAIKLRPETRERLEALKIVRRETIDEVIVRLLAVYDAQTRRNGQGGRPDTKAS